MGFFKNIGKGLKKVTGGIKKFVKKNVNFKGLVKVASMVDPIGIVGGLAQQHEMKMQEAEALAQMQAEEAAALAQMNNTEILNAVDQKVQQNAIKTANPKIKEILAGALGGALQGAGGVIVDGEDVKNVGVKAVDNVATSWLKKNWLKLVGGILGTALVVFMFVKMLGGRKRGYRR